MIHIWHEDSENSVTTQLWKFLANNIKELNNADIQGYGGNEKLREHIEKAKFNSLYGMTVTNNIKDEVIFDNKEGWSEKVISNEKIQELLEKEKKLGFLSFSYGVWVTAYARYNLLSNLIKLDEYVIYADTDSLKLRDGFDIEVINNYNKSVIEKIKKVSNELEIDINKFCPTDSKGIKHELGVFDHDAFYKEFITQRCKKICIYR